MLTLSRVFVRWDYEPISVSELDPVTDFAFSQAEAAEIEYMHIGDLGISARVRQGSVTAVVIIVAAAQTLLNGIGTYGGFAEGVATIRRHARSAGDFIRTRLRGAPQLPPSLVRSTRVTTGSLTSLDRIFGSVESGELGPDDAVVQVLRVIRRSGEPLTPDIERSLEEAFGAQKQAPLRIRLLDQEVVESRAMIAEQPGLGRRYYVEGPPKSQRQRGYEISRNPGSSHVEHRDLY